jgi:hypothetical protein
VIKDTFVSDPECGPQDLQTMVDNWFNIEEDQDVMYAVVDDELEELEREAQAITDPSPYEDDSEPEEFVDDTAQDIIHVQMTGA